MAQDFTYRGPVVVFDLDDTLALERLYCLTEYRKTGVWPGEHRPDPVDSSGCSEDLPDEEYVLDDGVEETLNHFMKNGVRMALITDGKSETQRAKIKALGLERYFAPETIFISGETGVDKHSPDSFENTVRLFPEAKCFWYVGDNPEKDFRWPNLLGWETVCVKDFRHLHIFPQDDCEWPYAAKHKIKLLPELTNLLKG